MKKAILLLICIALSILIYACGSNPLQSEPVDTVVTLVDYFSTKEMPGNTQIEKVLPEYPGIIFIWSSKEFVAVKDGVKTVLIQGMPVWSVFAVDLNGDSMPELCATISFGSGIIDNRVIIVDYISDKHYEISARFEYDFHLSEQDNKLVITRRHAKPDNTGSDTGSLSIKNQQLIIEYTNGETERIDAKD